MHVAHWACEPLRQSISSREEVGEAGALAWGEEASGGARSLRLRFMEATRAPRPGKGSQHQRAMVSYTYQYEAEPGKEDQRAYADPPSRSTADGTNKQKAELCLK